MKNGKLNSGRFSFNRFGVASLLTLLLTLGAPQSSWAAVKTWTGTTDGTWATGANWGGTIPVTGDSLVFTSATGAGGLTLSDNLMTPGTFSLVGITFNAGSGAYVINPGTPGTNGFTLAGNITNSSTSLQTINDLITITAPRTITTTTGGGNVTLGGNISGTGGQIVVGGTGVLTLSGSNSFTGATVTATDGVTYTAGISIGAAASTLVLGSSSAAGSNVIYVTGNSTIQAGAGGTTISNSIQTNGNNGSTLTFGGTNALTINGNVGFSQGQLVNVSNTALTTITGQFQLRNRLTSAGGTTISGAGNLLISGTVVNNSGGTGTGGAPLTAVGSLVYNGTGTLTLSGTNTYTGTTTVGQGSLIAGTNSAVSTNGAFGNAAGAITLGSTSLTGAASILTNGAYTIGRNITEIGASTNSTLSIGGIQTSGTSTYTGNITMTKATTLTSAAGGQVDFTTGIISGAFNVAIDGGGTVRLTGANTFGSATAHANSVTIQGGTKLNLASAGSTLGAVGNDLVFNNGTLQFAAAFDPSATRTMVFNSGGAGFDTNGNTITFASAVGNSGTGGLTLNDSNVTPGTLILSAVNTYTGGNTVTSGTLQLSGTGTLGGTGGALTVNTGGRLDLNGTSQGVGAVSGTGGTIVNNSGSGTSTLTVGSGNGSGGSYAGVIANNTTGAGVVALTKTGSGTVTLTGANTYTGATAINGGVLTIGGASGTLANTVITAAGGTLGIGTSGSTLTTTLGNGSGGSITVNSGGGLSLINGAINSLTINSVSATNGLIFGGGGMFGVDVSGSTADSVTFGSGVLVLASGSTSVNITLLSSLTGGTLTLIAGDFTTSGTGNFSLGTITNTGFLNGYTLSLSETSSGLLLNMLSTSNAYWKGGTSGSWSTIGNFTTDAAGTTARSAAIDSSTVVTYGATGAANFAPSTLDGSYTIDSLVFNIGGVTINNGTGSNTLTIASGGGISMAGGLGAVTDTLNANLALGSTQTWTVTDAASTLAVNGNISGSGFGLSKSGAGTLVLSGTNSYTGATTISAGNLKVTSNGALGGTSGVSVASGAALQVDGGITTSSATALTLNGTGVGTAGALESISGTNTYTGLITLGSATTIGVNSGSNLILSNTGTITGPGFNLTLSGAGDGSIAGIIGTGSGSLTKNGGGTWTLNAANTYSGGTTINNGTLVLGSSASLGGAIGALTVNSGGALNMGGTSQTVGNLTGTGGSIIGNGGTNTLTIGSGNGTGGNYQGTIVNGTGTLGLIKTGSGTITLSGTNTYTGLTNLGGSGTIIAANTSALGNVASALTLSGSTLDLATNTSINAYNTTVSANTTIISDRSTAGAGITHTLGTLAIGANMLNTTKGTIVTAATSPGIAFGATTLNGTASGTTTFNPTTASISLGSVTGSATAGNVNTLNLDGVATTGIAAAGTITGAISNGAGGGTVAVSKTNSSTWILSGTNTYTGSTTLNGGILQATTASALGTGGAITFGGGTLQYGAGNTTDYSSRFTAATGNQDYKIDTNGNNVIFGTALAAAGTSGLSKSGLGTLTLSVNPGYSGTAGTSISGGVLITQDATISTLKLSGGGANLPGGVWQPILISDLNITSTLGSSTGAGQINSWGGGGLGAKGANINVNLNSGAQLLWGGGFMGNGDTPLVFGTTTSDHMVTLANAINMNTTDAYQRNFYVEKGLAGSGGRLSGVLSSGTGTTGFLKIGGGSLYLSGANNYTGTTGIANGYLVAENNSSNDGVTAGAFGVATSAITLGDVGGLGGKNALAGSDLGIMISGGNYTVARAINITATTNAINSISVGGLTDNNTTFSGAITANQSFQVTQAATTSTNALHINGGISAGTAGTKTVTFNNVGAVQVGGVIGNGTGTVAVSQTGTGTTTFSTTNTYTGGTTVSAGTLAANNTSALGTGNVMINGGTLLIGSSGTVSGTSAVTINAGGTFRYNSATTYGGGAITNAGGSISGTGNLGATVLGGTGSIDPGNSPGKLTVDSTDPTSGLDYNFEFTLKNSGLNYLAVQNDVLQLTSGFAPFTSDLTSANVLSLYIDAATYAGLASGDFLIGGFYADAGDFYTNVQNATITAYYANALGPVSYNGQNYSLLTSGTFAVSTLSDDNLVSGGFVSEFTYTAVPEPSTYALLALGLGSLWVLRRKRS